MQKKRLPDPLFWINTDKSCYSRNHPDDQEGSPFARFWLSDGYAYVTPPKKNSAKYDAVLRLMEPGDPVFAYENKVGIVAMGIVQEKPNLMRCPEQLPLYPAPDEIVKRFKVEWDPSVNYPASEIYRETGYVRGTLRQRADSVLYRLRERSPLWLLQEDSIREQACMAKLKTIEDDRYLASKDREAITRARVGQGRFRANLLKLERQCRITGVRSPEHLIASHIKPWVLCEGNEHWDGNNGLLLAPHLDHLFDHGKISFDDAGNLLISRLQDRDVLRAWAVPEVLNVGHFNAEQCRYLAFHRDCIFEQTHPWRKLLQLPRQNID